MDTTSTNGSPAPVPSSLAASRLRFLGTARARDLLGITGLVVTRRDPDGTLPGDPGDLMLYLDMATGRRFICVCMAEPDVWSKVEVG